MVESEEKKDLIPDTDTEAPATDDSANTAEPTSDDTAETTDAPAKEEDADEPTPEPSVDGTVVATLGAADEFFKEFPQDKTVVCEKTVTKECADYPAAVEFFSD